LRNPAVNVLYLGSQLVNPTISCIALWNNSCQSGSPQCLVAVLSTLTMSNCVFQSNTFDYFVATSSSLVTTTFNNCVFDTLSLLETGSLTVLHSGNVIVFRTTLLPQCIQTANPHRTVTARPRTASPGANDSAPVTQSRLHEPSTGLHTSDGYLLFSSHVTSGSCIASI
jgi:hypothetical protein